MRSRHRRLLLGAIGAGALLVPQACSGGNGGEAPEEGTSIELTVWSQSGDTEFWRADGPARAAEDVETWDITVEAVNDSAGWEDYKRKFTLAADTGEAPDIVVSGHEDVATWGAAGYIIPFEDCRDAHPEFDDVIESLWDSAMWNDQLWAVPQDTEARPMYFNKTLLGELGWTADEIDTLPDRIAAGEFTLDDMIETANEAVEAGVVASGHGYWHRPTKGGDFLQYYNAFGGELYDAETDQLVIDREALISWYAFQQRVADEGITPRNYIDTEFEVWHSTVTAGDVLFFNGGVWHWSDWAANYIAEEGGQDYLFEHFGYALQPTGTPEQEPGTLSHPLVYMITSPEASGNDNQDAACELLAKTTTDEINTLHAIESTHLGVLETQADYPDYADDRLLSETLPMTESAFYQPNHVHYGQYFDSLWDGMVQAQDGGVDPAEAADAVIARVEAEIGDAVVVRD